MKESQVKMMEHSEVKIRLLKLYLERYLNILSASKFVGNIHLFDLFCGEGIYKNGGKGSPVIILETIKNIYFQQKALGKNLDKFNCLFNDIDKAKLSNLSTEIENRKLHYAEIGNIKLTGNDYKDILPFVINEINILKKEKAFIFIDPYGYKEIRISNIKSLMQSGKSEVLLFLPTQFMFRFENNGTPESLIEFIDELMPVEMWPVSETGIDFIENLTSAFRNTMGAGYYVDSFIITRDKNQFFCLFFFTSHIYGFEKMLESKWNIDKEDGRGWIFNQESDLFSQIDKKPNILRFENNLMEFLKENRTNRDIYQFTLNNGHLPTHTNDILLKLQNEGRLNVNLKNGMIARKSSFYINHDTYKNDPYKVTISLK